MKVEISLDGCDDYTKFEMEVTEAELEFLKRIAAKSEEVSTYGCMPTLAVDVVTEVTL